MHNLFSQDSAFVRFFTAITNIMLVNILWLLCCLPLFTAGAATTAAYYTFFRIVTGEDEAVVKPFFKAFKDNFKQATLLWIPMLLIGGVLLLDLMYLLANHAEQFHVLWVPFFVTALLYLIPVSHCFAIMGRYDAPTKQILKNSYLIFLMNFLRSLAALALTVVPGIVLVSMPRLVVQTLPFWFILFFGLVLYLNARMFLISFEKSAAKEEEEQYNPL